MIELVQKAIKEYETFSGSDGYIIVDGLDNFVSGGKKLLSDLNPIPELPTQYETGILTCNTATSAIAWTNSDDYKGIDSQYINEPLSGGKNGQNNDPVGLAYNSNTLELTGTVGNKRLSVKNPVPDPGTNQHRGEVLKVNDSDEIVWEAQGSGLPNPPEFDGTVLTYDKSRNEPLWSYDYIKGDNIRTSAPLTGGGSGSVFNYIGLGYDSTLKLVSNPSQPNARDLLGVTNPVPSPGTNQHRGDVLKVNSSDQPEWGALNGTLTIQQNGTKIVTFSANQTSACSANITVPTVNNGKLTIQQNGTLVTAFSANQSNSITANISVPTTTSQLSNNSNYISATSQGSTSRPVYIDGGEVKSCNFRVIFSSTAATGTNTLTIVTA